MKYLAVKNWEHYQHYRGRTPPWIKLHNSLLDDHAFLQLSDTARGQLVLVWLIASRHKNRIPNDARYVSRAIQTTSRLQLNSLIDAGFLYETDEEPSAIPLAPRKQVASAVLAERKQSAIPEVEREREKETTSRTPKPRAVRKYPFFPDSDFSTLLTAWCSTIGVIDAGRFKRALAPLYPEAGARYPTPTLLLAMEAAYESAKEDRGGFALRNLTPETWVGKIAYWVEWVNQPAEVRAERILGVSVQ